MLFAPLDYFFFRFRRKVHCCAPYSTQPSSTNPPPRVTGPEAAGLRHLAFHTDNIEETVKELEEKGIEVEPVRVDEYSGGRFTFFKDPDGLPLELHE